MSTSSNQHLVLLALCAVLTCFVVSSVAMGHGSGAQGDGSGSSDEDDLSALLTQAVEETKRDEEIKRLINDAVRISAEDAKARDLAKEQQRLATGHEMKAEMERAAAREAELRELSTMKFEERWKYTRSLFLRVEGLFNLKPRLRAPLPQRVTVADAVAQMPAKLYPFIHCTGGKAPLEASANKKEKWCASDFTDSITHHTTAAPLQRNEDGTYTLPTSAALFYHAPYSNMAQCQIYATFTMTVKAPERKKKGWRFKQDKGPQDTQHTVTVDFGVFRAFARDGIQSDTAADKTVTGLPFETKHESSQESRDSTAEVMSESAKARLRRGRGLTRVPVFQRGVALDRAEAEHKLKGPTMVYQYGEQIGTIQASIYPGRIYRPREEQAESLEPPKPSTWLNHDKCPLVLAHRAAPHALAKENQLDSLWAGLSLADGVEIDVFLARDESKGTSEVVVFHDEDLGRVLGVEFTDGGSVGNRNSDGSRKSAQERREARKNAKNVRAGITRMYSASMRARLTQVTNCQSMPTLSDFLTGIKKTRWDANRPFKLNIELKPGDPRQKMWKGYRADLAKGVSAVLAQPAYKPHLKDIVVTSFDPWKIKEVNQETAARSISVASGTATIPGLGAGVLKVIDKIFRVSRSRVVQMRYDQINPKNVARLHRKGIPVGTFTMFDSTKSSNDPSYDWAQITNLVVSEVDWIETDNTQRLKEALRTMCGLYKAKMLVHKPSEK